MERKGREGKGREGKVLSPAETQILNTISPQQEPDSCFTPPGLTRERGREREGEKGKKMGKKEIKKQG